MKKYNQNHLQVNQASRLNARQPFFRKPKRSYYINIGAAICAVIFLHLVAQFTFFKGEGSENDISSAKTEKSVEINTEYKAKKPDIVEMPADDDAAAAPPNIQPKQPAIAPSRTALKKKESRESRAERLRRAEKILTGV